MSRNRLRIFLVEDNPADAKLFRLALTGASRDSLAVATDGEEAVVRLREMVNRDPAPPNLVVLDLNIPRLDGRAVLREMKKDPRLRLLPVVVLTHSTDTSDVDAAYKEYASCYVVKPLDLREFREIVRALEHFWTSIARLPAP